MLDSDYSFPVSFLNQILAKISYLVANPPVPPLVLVFFLFMMQNYSAIEDAKPQGLAKTPTKKNLRISEMFDFLGY